MSIASALLERDPKKDRLWYAASPYTHDDNYVQSSRVYWAHRLTAAATAAGFLIFSPIVYSDRLKMMLPVNYNWIRLDLKLLEVCDGLVVFTLDGWQKSAGVKAEIEFAETLGTEILYYDPYTCEAINENRRNLVTD